MNKINNLVFVRILVCFVVSQKIYIWLFYIMLTINVHGGKF